MLLIVLCLTLSCYLWHINCVIRLDTISSEKAKPSRKNGTESPRVLSFKTAGLPGKIDLSTGITAFFTIFRRGNMIIQKRRLFFLSLFFAGLLLMTTTLAKASINTGTPSYEKRMQVELDLLLEQVSGQFEATGNYPDQSSFYAILAKGLAGQSPIKSYFDQALAAQGLADANRGNPELQEKARIAMDDLFLAILNQVALNTELAATDQEITQALIDILEGRGEGFTTETRPFVLDASGSRENPPVIPPDEDADEEGTEEDLPPSGFLFYGRTYDLETAVDPEKSVNGVLWFVEGPDTEGFLDEQGDLTVPAIVPFFFERKFVDGEDDALDPYLEPVFETPKVTKHESFNRYTWSRRALISSPGQDSPPVPPISASLYENSWIAFVYDDLSDVDLPDNYGISVGLIPGNGEKAFHPGTGTDRADAARGDNGLDLSEETGNSFSNDAQGEYLVVMEDFKGYEDEGPAPFDFSDWFLVFRPDARDDFNPKDQGIGNKYTVEAGDPFMIVDKSRHHYDESLSSLDEAILHIADNPTTLSGNDFRPGKRLYRYGPALGGEVEAYTGDWDGLNRWLDIAFLENGQPYVEFKGDYEYGLQTLIGRKSYGEQSFIFTPQDTIERIDNSNFLAYAVQVEEDRVNEKILGMSSRADARDIINGVRDYQNIRDRDAFFVRTADAQTGIVSRDIHGNWVRVQQYILRSQDQKTMSVLNVSLREAGSMNGLGQDISGMSTIDFSTTFTDPLPGEESMRILPWIDYLTTRIGENDSKYISYYASDARELTAMSVKFTNPGNESVRESRDFNGRVYYEPTSDSEHDARQYISSETLTLENTMTSQAYTNAFTFHPHPSNPQPRYGYYTSDYAYRSDFTAGPASGYYAVLPDTEDTKILDVALYSLKPFDRNGDYQNQSYEAISAEDIWAVLGKGDASDLSVYAEEMIEITMDNPEGSGFFARPIDTIYIPMSHMVWANDYQNQFFLGGGLN